MELKDAKEQTVDRERRSTPNLMQRFLAAATSTESFCVSSPRVILMRQIAIGRIVGLLVAIAGVGISIWCAREAVRLNAEFHQWLEARPMETEIDFSKPGETTAPFHQTCSISHGEALYLDCDFDDEAKQNPEGLFADLLGKSRCDRM